MMTAAICVVSVLNYESSEESLKGLVFVLIYSLIQLIEIYWVPTTYQAL